MNDEQRPEPADRADPVIPTSPDMTWVTPATGDNTVVVREPELLDVDYVWNTRGDEGIYPRR